MGSEAGISIVQWGNLSLHHPMNRQGSDGQGSAAEDVENSKGFGEHASGLVLQQPSLIQC
jgi:hypothetical protein